jgi:hypothetical protein
VGIVGRVTGFQQSCQALIFERDAQNQPLGVAAGQIRRDRSEPIRTFSIAFRPFQIPPHLTGHRTLRKSVGRMHTSGAHVVHLKPELDS